MRKGLLLGALIIALLCMVCVNANAAMLILQPDAADGKDACITSNLPDSNFGSTSYLTVNYGPGITNYGLLEFDLSSIGGSTINSATLTLRHRHNNVFGSTFSLYRITSPWSESTVTWNAPPSWVSSPGSSLHITDGAAYVFRDWDVTNLVQSWANGTYNNYGMLLKRDDQGAPHAYFLQSDWADNTYDPKLTVDYTQGVIPEPATMLLFGTGLLGAGLFRRKKGKLL